MSTTRSTSRRALVVGSFVVAAALGAAGGLVYLAWVVDQIDAAEEAMAL